MSHDRISATFDEWVRDGRAEKLEEHHADIVSQVLPKLGIRPGMQTLDLGCGTGWATRLLAAAAPGAGAIGIDVSAEMLARAEELHDLTSRARYERCTFEELDFPDGKFDRVFSMEALYYAVDLPRATAEIHRVLKPGGEAHILINRYRESPHSASWDDMVGLEMAFLGQDEWIALFSEAGFVQVDAERIQDSRGPGEESEFTPDAHCSDYTTARELHAAGTLWLRAIKGA